ncbi:MAG: hypothetical protein KC560_00415 [Myxococcales bacterium]|nr:hypothetical protein [Myxococcales bacterium]
MRSIALVALLGGALAAPARGEPDLNQLAIDWARGRYVSPVICDIEGAPVRGGRRVLVAPGPRRVQPPVARLTFSDLDVPLASRCFDDRGTPAPNLLGHLDLRLPGRTRADTARRDFAAALRRERGFSFHVSEGTLRTIEVGSGATRDVDFRGGTATLREIEAESDDARLLADLEGLRKLVLELVASDGTRLRLPLVMTRPR